VAGRPDLFRSPKPDWGIVTGEGECQRGNNLAQQNCHPNGGRVFEQRAPSFFDTQMFSQPRQSASDSFLISFINSSTSNGGLSYTTPGRLPVIGTIARALKTASSGSPSCIQGKFR